jgi:hypothetical protein
MKRTGHTSAEAARAELGAHGYYPAHQPPHEPGQRWRKPPKGKRGKVDPSTDVVVARETRARSCVWHILPASAMKAAATARELEAHA